MTGDLCILGSVDAKLATDSKGAGKVSAKNVYVGITAKAVTGAAATASGSFTISGFLYVADGSSIPAELVDGKKSLQVYVEGELWMTVYAMGANNEIKITEIPVENVDLDSWVDKDGKKIADANGNITIKDNVIYAKIVYDVYTVTITVCAGIDDVYIDGVLVDTSLWADDIKVSAGDHTISYTLANGYSGTATMLVNGEKVTEYKFTASGDYTTADYMITLQGIEKSGYVPESPDVPAPVEPTKDDSMGITEYLLIVLVILAAILVVVVAIRMMRS